MNIQKFEFNMFPVNCYVLWDETNEAVVIDPGCFYEEEKLKLKQFIESNQLKVKHLLNTHLHLDHTFGNAYMQREFGLKAEAHQADEFLIEEAPNHSRMFGFELPEAIPALGKYINEDDLITFGNTTLRILHVPGHSPGGLVYYSEKDKCIFSGDVLFRGSVGRADLKGGNYDDLIEYISQKLFTLPDDTVVYPGHGPSTTIGFEKTSNPFFR